MKKKVILLGASGFLGRSLSAALQRVPGIDVFGYSSSEINLLQKNRLRQLDPVADSNTAVVLLSAVTPDREDSDQTARKNVRMVENIAEYFQNHPVGKCVYFSSSAVYGNISNDSINEKTEVHRGTHYAGSKIEGERILQAAAAACKMDLILLRPVAVFGPGDTHVSYGISRFFRSILERGEVRLFGDGTDLRDHLYVKDFVGLTLGFTLGNFKGTYNLASGKSYSFLELIETIREVVSVPFGLSFEPRRIPLVHQRFDIAQLKNCFPEFKFTELKKGLEETCRAFRKGVKETQNV